MWISKAFRVFLLITKSYFYKLRLQRSKHFPSTLAKKKTSSLSLLRGKKQLFMIKNPAPCFLPLHNFLIPLGNFIKNLNNFSRSVTFESSFKLKAEKTFFEFNITSPPTQDKWPEAFCVPNSRDWWHKITFHLNSSTNSHPLLLRNACETKGG